MQSGSLAAPVIPRTLYIQSKPAVCIKQVGSLLASLWAVSRAWQWRGCGPCQPRRCPRPPGAAACPAGPQQLRLRLPPLAPPPAGCSARRGGGRYLLWPPKGPAPGPACSTASPAPACPPPEGDEGAARAWGALGHTGGTNTSMQLARGRVAAGRRSPQYWRQLETNPSTQPNHLPTSAK